MRYLTLALLAAVAIVACKSNTSNPVNASGSDYFPLTAGSWWDFATYQTDSMNIKVPGSDATERDSVVGAGTVQGRAVTLVRVTTATTVDTTDLYQAPNGDIMAFLDTTSNGSKSGVWQTIADVSSSSVGTTTTENDTLSYPIGGTTYAFPETTLHTYLADETVTVGAGAFSTQLRRDSSVAGIPLLASVTISTRSNLAPGVGPVKQVVVTRLVVSPLLGLPISNSTNGSVRTMTAYHVY